jgi:glutathione peroxidase
MPAKLYSYPIQKADGSTTTLNEYAGKVLLVVNVASKCGLTPQYDALQSLFARYREKGLMVLGFPANEFLKQEPGTDAEIQEFCRLNFGVEFPVFAKVVVKGPGQHPLYQYLTQTRPQAQPAGGWLNALMTLLRPKPKTQGDISWNFEKFLVSRQGEVVARFAPGIKPEDPRIVTAIEKELGKA